MVEASALALLSACSAPNPAYQLGTTSGSGGTGAADGTTRPITTGADDASDEAADTAHDGMDGDTSVDPDTGADTSVQSDSGPTTSPPDDSTTGGTPYAEPHPCCESDPAAGCVDEEVETCTCGIDPECCSSAWDAICVDEATALCGMYCFDTSSCCVAGEGHGCGDTNAALCVCDQEPACCNESWSLDCVLLVESCTGSVCALGGSSCCATQVGSHGCDDLATQACVCGMDPACCRNEWDSICVVEAIDCGSDCIPAGPADCCDPAGSFGGCTDNAGGPGVQNCVCDIDPMCCDEGWTSGCVQLATGQCGLTC